MNISKIAMGACCLLLTGCVGHSSYPATWPALVKAAGVDCPDLSGRYNNAAYPPHSRRFDYLYDALTNAVSFQGSGMHECGYCVVQLQWLDETHDALRVRLINMYPTEHLFSQHDEVETLRRSRGEFDCHDGGLTVARAVGLTELVNTLVKWGNITFFPAEDGSLVALAKDQMAGYLLFVIPIYAKYNDYTRWLRAHTPEPPTSTDTPNNPVEAPAATP